MLVDDFGRADKAPNLEGKPFALKIHRDIFPAWFALNAQEVHFVFHIGARTDTTAQDRAIFDRLNYAYSIALWDVCAKHGIPFIYASSAATYGDGSLGFEDRNELTGSLRPLNPYARSKNDFDHYALHSPSAPPYFVGLKFFNVYGPNEYHKGRMASVIFHTYHQIRRTGAMQLFRSHRPDFADGQQSRDFVYVKDVLRVCQFLYDNRVPNGLYNLGTGKARSFYDLAANTFLAMGLQPNISYIDMPEDIRDTYQYFTQAEMRKLHGAGYGHDFHSLEAGIADYVGNYLLLEQYF